MEVWGKVVMKDEQKADVLNAFIAFQPFTARPVVLRTSRLLSQKTGTWSKMRNQYPRANGH